MHARTHSPQSVALTAPPPSQKMQKIVAALALSGASALVAPAAPRATVKVQETKADLERLCAENPTALPFEGIWDPLGCADFNFWGLGNEATIGYLRHAEIKHGRIAMAGFLGFFVQSPGNFIGDIVSGDHAILPYRGYVAGCTPQEQWANIPMIGKLQILTAVGMLESYGEGAGYPESYTHYTKGGQPGYYPPIKGKGPAWKSTNNSSLGPFKQILLDLRAAAAALRRPLGFGFRDMSAADKKKIFSRDQQRPASSPARPLRPARLRLPRHVCRGQEEGPFGSQQRPHGHDRAVEITSLVDAPHRSFLGPRGVRGPPARTRSTKSSTSTCRRATSTSWARSSPSSPRPSR